MRSTPLLSASSRRPVGWLALSATVLMLAACASVPPPNDAMARAQAQLKAARDAGAADSDPVDMDFAQKKLQQAQVAMSNKKYADAANLAEESHADAQLAFTKARLATLRQRIRQRGAENARLSDQLQQREQQMQTAQRAMEQGTTDLPEQVLPMPSNAGSSAPNPAAASTAATPAPAGTAALPAPASSTAGGGQ